jgi:hypothetical protein
MNDAKSQLVVLPGSAQALTNGSCSTKSSNILRRCNSYLSTFNSSPLAHTNSIGVPLALIFPYLYPVLPGTPIIYLLALNSRATLHCVMWRASGVRRRLSELDVRNLVDVTTPRVRPMVGLRRMTSLRRE